MDIETATRLSILVRTMLGATEIELPPELFYELTNTIWVLRESLQYLRPQGQQWKHDSVVLTIKGPEIDYEPTHYRDIGRDETWIIVEAETTDGQTISHPRILSKALGQALCVYNKKK